MNMLIAIALGGASGALLRHFVSGAIMHLLGSEFPYGTFAVNIIGSLVMGLLITGFALKFEGSQELRGFLTVGLLGSFTTFSTFSLEIALMIERGDIQGAVIYIISSLFIGVLGLFAGMWLGKVLL